MDELSIPLNDDEIGEPTGTILVTLIPGIPAQPSSPPPYQVGAGALGNAMARIWDDDAPELKITGGDTVTEGENVMAMFTISSMIQPPVDPTSTTRDIAVDYTPISANFLAANESGTEVEAYTLTFTGTEAPYTATLPIAVHNDDVAEANGSITVTLNQNDPDGTTGSIAGYTVAGAPANPSSASVSVRDDDSIPTLTIVADETDVIENQAGGATFTVTATGVNSATSLDVSYSVANLDSADFLDSVRTDSDDPVKLTFTEDSSGKFIKVISVALDDDAVGEATGTIQLTLHSDSAAPNITYKVGSESTASTRIWDDDALELSIAGGATVTEGDNVQAIFTITSIVQPPVDPTSSNRDIAIDYTPVSANFLADGTTGVEVTNHTLTFTGEGPYTADLPITVASDTVAEANGVIMVTLTQRAAVSGSIPGYTVAAAPNNSAIVEVRDDDSIPTLTIVADETSFAENVTGGATFTVSAIGVTATTNLAVSITTANVWTADFLASPTTSVVSMTFEEDSEGQFCGTDYGCS